ncbi:hypothetical protein OROMI_028671 [Orobanche minor]
MDSTVVASNQFLHSSSGKRIEDVHTPPQRPRIVSFEEAKRLLAIMKRMDVKFNIADNPPVYREDAERDAEENTKNCAAMALDHYNATTEGPKYELVEAIYANGIIHVGLWYHVSFTAKSISTGADADTSPNHFFAEIAYHLIGEGDFIFCCIVDPNSPDTIDGCGSCSPNVKMYHPKAGFQIGNWPYNEDIEIHVDNYYDASVPMERRVKFCYQ